MNRSTQIDTLGHVPDHSEITGKTADVLEREYPFEEKMPDEFWGNHYDIPFPFSDSSDILSKLTLAFEKVLAYTYMLLLLPLVALAAPVIVFRQKKQEENWAMFAVNFLPRLFQKELSVCVGCITVSALLLANVTRCIAVLIQSLF